jgi:alkanesulfonate monooxygenase
MGTAARLLCGRVAINIVCGHTPTELRGYGCFLDHDRRYEQAGEFLESSRALWGDRHPRRTAGGVDPDGDLELDRRYGATGRASPEIYLGGNSPQAAELAARHADCLFRFAEAPSTLRPQIEQVLAAGKEVGLLVALIARRTRGEALAASEELVSRFAEPSRAAHRDFARKSDSVAFVSTYDLARCNPSGWITETLWAGAVPYLGAPAIALVGSAEEVAGAILEYKRLGVSQFLFLGWPDLEEMTFFGREVLPLIRRMEQRPIREGGEVCL